MRSQSYVCYLYRMNTIVKAVDTYNTLHHSTRLSCKILRPIHFKVILDMAFLSFLWFFHIWLLKFAQRNATHPAQRYATHRTQRNATQPAQRSVTQRNVTRPNLRLEPCDDQIRSAFGVRKTCNSSRSAHGPCSFSVAVSCRWCSVGVNSYSIFFCSRMHHATRRDVRIIAVTQQHVRISLRRSHTVSHSLCTYYTEGIVATNSTWGMFSQVI